MCTECLCMLNSRTAKDGMQREASEEAYCKTETSRSEARDSELKHQTFEILWIRFFSAF